MNPIFDVAIIGGGINGCGCAADASLRGLSVVLFEKDDLASKTSSSSTKLIHGGLRYLENYEFSLVKKALEERQRLLTLAPHIVHPQAMILPYQKHMRPAWFLRLGLFFYDYLSRTNRLPKSKSIQRGGKSNYFAPLINAIKRGFFFYDASTDDARLTLVNALQARNHGASIRPRSTVLETKVSQDYWQLTIQPESGAQYTVFAKSLINAAGPWVESVETMTHTTTQQKMALVKGSHIIVPKMYEGNHAYLLQNKDNRVIFVIPYHGFSMIGTTDVAFNGSLDKVHISDEEIDYLTDLVNAYFKVSVSTKDIVYSWSGIRPLLATQGREARTLSRDYQYHFTEKPAPAITIYGGKITTYRQLAEDVVNQLKPLFPAMLPCATRYTPLPGANINGMDFSKYSHYAREKYKWLGSALLSRYLNSYGTCLELFMSSCTDFSSMGIHFGGSLYQVEVDYLIKNEWACNVDDILKRRTKLILEMGVESQNKLVHYLGVKQNANKTQVEMAPTSTSIACSASSLNADSGMLPASE